MALSVVDTHSIKIEVIKHPVVYPFIGSMFIINLLIFIRPSCHRSIEPDRYSMTGSRPSKWSFPWTEANLR